MLWSLFATLALLLSLAVAALATPAKLSFAMRTSPTWRLRVAARLFGGLTPSIPVHDSARAGRKRRRPPAKRRRVATASRRALARAPRVIAAAPRLLADLLRPIHVERLRVDADIGLADPADTGQLFGLLAAVSHALQRAPAASIAVRPNFTGPRVSGELDAALSFIPISFIPAGARFAFRIFGS